MKHFLLTLLLIAAVALFTACGCDDEFSNDPEGNFDALWTLIDEHYTLFAYKGIDWQEVGQRYRAKVTSDMTSQELFDVCGTMLKELRDGHTNLISGSDVSRYWIWEQYPENYDERLVEEQYLNFDYKQTSGIKYQILTSNIGYMRYASFSSNIGDGNLDNVLSHMASSDGLIVDVRSNGGGYLSNVETLVRRFLTERTLVGSISHKTGPGHSDFSEPYSYYYSPASDRVRYSKPVVVLCNRSTFSAANNFVSIMKLLPQVTVVGDTTGGGCGLPFNGELPNGWSVRFSSALIRDAQGQLTEFGVSPDVEAGITQTDIAEGRDPMIDKAIEILTR